MVKSSYFPNAPSTCGKTYYVAQKHPKASDNNPGTKNMPFRTISRAAAAVDMGDRIVIGAGTYREQIPVKRHGHQYVPGTIVTFMAAEGDRVWIKGSDVFSGRWEKAGGYAYRAKLPKELFKKGAYNPYALSCVVDDRKIVRPCKGKDLQETLGQVYVDGKALDQVGSDREVEEKRGAFIVSAGGREIIASCPDGKSPEGRPVELTMRAKCFQAEFAGAMFIQTTGLVAEHAAEPDPFCRCRPLSIRRNGRTGIIVRKTFHLPANTDWQCTLTGYWGPSYTDVKGEKMIENVADDTQAGTPEQLSVIEMRSDDSGRTWKPRPETRVLAAKKSCIGYFLDEQHNILVRHFIKSLRFSLDGDASPHRRQNMVQYSRDGGQTWSKAEKVDQQKMYYRMLKLRDGTILWPFTDNCAKTGYRACMGARIGKWRVDLNGVDWKYGGKLEAGHDGLDEPSACQLDDGRIFMIFRQSARAPAGVLLGKLYAVSGDNGRSWSTPKPLTYDDGKYVYSPEAMAEIVRAPKSGKIYAILNIINAPSGNCDPRQSLQIAELDQKSLCLKRRSVAIIDSKLEGQHYLVRFSNWATMIDRVTGNLVLFMKMHMSEHCPVRNGYDQNSYRYDIKLHG